MSQPHWTLLPKLKPELVETHTGLAEELAAANQELGRIGFVARLLPGPGKRRRQLTARVKNLEVQIAACYGEIGWDLDPPRIGFDEKATKWYRDHLGKDPDAWPLPLDEMLEEMHGTPVWELCEHVQVQHLDVGWPKGGYPVPVGPGLSMELLKRLARHLSPEEALPTAERLQEETFAYLKRRYPELEPLDPARLIRAVVIESAVPGKPKGTIAPEDVQATNTALGTAQWLEFWGGHGYSFKYSEPVG